MFRPKNFINSFRELWMSKGDFSRASSVGMWKSLSCKGFLSDEGSEPDLEELIAS